MKARPIAKKTLAVGPPRTTVSLLPAREAKEDSRYERRIGCHAPMDQTLGSRVHNQNWTFLEGVAGRGRLLGMFLSPMEVQETTHLQTHRRGAIPTEGYTGRSDKPHLEPTMTIIEISSDSPGWYW